MTSDFRDGTAIPTPRSNLPVMIPGSQTRADDVIVLDKVLHFRSGLPGFPDLERFVIADFKEQGAFQEMQSLDDPDISMIVCVPWLFFPDYSPVLSDAEQEQLELTSTEDAAVFVAVSLDAESRQISLNLLGPFVVNVRTREGCQLVLAGSDYPARATIVLPTA